MLLSSIKSIILVILVVLQGYVSFVVSYNNNNGFVSTSSLVQDDPPTGGNTTNTTLQEFGTSRITVQIPFTLHDPNGYEHIQADFGFYNTKKGSIQTFVYYFEDETFCDPIANLTVLDEHGKIHPSSTTTTSPTVQLPFIALIKSNLKDCSAITKAKNARAIGASAFVIGYDTCRCYDPICIHTYGDIDCINTTITLSKDGSAVSSSLTDVSIPTFLLHRQNTEQITATTESKQSVLMELTWGIAPPPVEEYTTKAIQYRLWTTVLDPVLDHTIIQEIKLISSAFNNDQAVFTPHYSLVDGIRFNCQNSEPPTNTTAGGPCDHLCTNNGRYCTGHVRDISGYALLKETVRRLCIWKYYGSPSTAIDKKGNIAIFWDYIIQHRVHCSSPHAFADETCIEQAYEAAKIPITDPANKFKEINDCLAGEGNIDTDQINPLLQHQLDTQKDFGIVEVPIVTVEKQSIKDKVSASNLFITICDYYWSLTSPFTNATSITNYPTICDKCGSCPNVLGCISSGGNCIEFTSHFHTHTDNHNTTDDPSKGGKSDKNHKKKHGWFWTFFFLFLICGSGYYYYITYLGGSLSSLWGNGSSSISDRAGLLNNYFQLGGED